MWLEDEYWLRAAKFVVEKSEQYKPIFAPAEFNRLACDCFPLSFTYIYEHNIKGLLVIPKGDVDLLPLTWIRNIHRFRVLYADEVFAAFDCNTLDVSDNEKHADARHLPYLFNMVKNVLAGKEVRKTAIDEALSTRVDTEPYALIVAKSMIGNAGDRMLPEALIKLLGVATPHLSCVVADGNIERQLVANAEIVVTGAGGMLSDTLSDSIIDFQNIASYFRVGLLAKEFHKPFFLLGTGYQGIASKRSWQYLDIALSKAKLITTRNNYTASLMASRYRCPVQALPDFSELFWDDIQEAASRKNSENIKILALCGDFKSDHADMKSVLTEIATRNPQMHLRFVVQAEEDFETLEIHKIMFHDVFNERFSVLDCRKADAATFISAIASCDAMITTRFHAMEIGYMAGISMVVFYHAGDVTDKKHWLSERLGPKNWICMQNDRFNQKERICEIVSHGCRDGKRVSKERKDSFKDLIKVISITEKQ